MKRKTLALTLVLALLFSAVVGAQFNKAKAETLGPLEMWQEPEPSGNIVIMHSPQNTTYYESSILLNFTVEAYYIIGDIGYSLDGGAVERVNNLTKISEEPAPYLYVPPYVRVTYSGNLLLSNLSKGNHSITVYRGYQYQGINKRYAVDTYATAFFTIDDPPKPKQSEPSPTTLVVASVITIAIVGIGLLVYFKKRKR